MVRDSKVPKKRGQDQIKLKAFVASKYLKSIATSATIAELKPNLAVGR